jgi:hypothetical protein
MKCRRQTTHSKEFLKADESEKGGRPTIQKRYGRKKTLSKEWL